MDIALSGLEVRRVCWLYYSTKFSGYESLGHFKSVFKRATGMSMRDFRKKPSSAAPAGTS